MPKLSAGLLPYRIRDGVLELFIVHPGGPFWQRKDGGAWSIAKGEYAEDEDPLDAARREFEEEVGTAPPGGGYRYLGQVRQPGGKRVSAWAVNGTGLSVERVRSNTFEMEWPRGSGRMQAFPEVDRAGWHTAAASRAKLSKGQVEFVDALFGILSRDHPDLAEEDRRS